MPLLCAFLMIKLEPLFTWLARERPAVLPISMFALVGGLLVARIRRWLIVVLCYAICLLAARDALQIYHLPVQIDYQIIESIYPFIWILLSLLAGIAGTMEAIHPSSIWARRCYFATASLYFSGHGLLSLLTHPTWEAVVLLVTSLVAFVGIFLAHKIIAAEEEMMPEDADIRALAEEADLRSKKLASREWRENH